MKSLRLLLVITFALALVVAVGPVQAQDGQDGEGGEVSCQEFGTILSLGWQPYTGFSIGSDGPFEEGIYTITIDVIEGGATVRLVADPAGAITLAGPASAPVIFTYTMPPVGEQPPGLGIYFDSVVVGRTQRTTLNISVDCGFSGCDAAVPIPADAVVGRMLDNASAYWEPGQLITDPPVVLEVGKTYWVAGQDATGLFRKVLISCQWVWVEFDKIGPNFDDVWNGTPLPATVVE